MRSVSNMKKRISYILLIVLLIFLKINVIESAACKSSDNALQPSWGYCPQSTYGDIIVTRISGQQKLNGYKYWYYARQFSHRDVYCIKQGDRHPVYNTCSTAYSFGANNDKLRAAIGYIIAYYSSDYAKTQYLIHQVLAAKAGGQSVPGNYYPAEYNNAISQYNNYPSVPGTYYLANFYNCGSGIQPIADGYETKVIQQKHTNSISHWTWGYVNGEGNNDDKRAFKIGETSFEGGVSGNTFVMDGSRGVTVPNGFYLNQGFGTSAISGSWNGYTFGTTVTQKNYAMSFEYDYYPYTYTITYNLNGGTNSSSNPSTYNVLYGVTFSNPTRSGYDFLGWYKDVLTSFSSKSDATISGNGVITFNNTTKGNEFDSSKIQVWGKNWEYYQQLKATSTPGLVSVLYTHEKDTGDYNVRLAANGNKKDSDVNYKVHFEKGRKYYMSWYLDNYSPSSIKISNFKIEGQVFGINEGANATFTSAQDLYNKLSNRTTGNITISAKWEKQVGTLNLKKVKQDGITPICSKYVTFDVYPSSDCSGVAKSFTIYTGADGFGTPIILDANRHYSVIETQAPDDYGKSGECIYIGYLNNSQEISKSIINKTQCEIDFEKDSSISNRLKLYARYKFRNLLNFKDKTTAIEACSVYDPDYDPQNECLSTDQVNNATKNKFTNKNLSDYNDTITAYPDSISYCLTDFELTKGPNVNYDVNTRVNAGRMIFNIDKEDSVAEGTLTRTCYIHKNEYNKYSVDITKENFIKLSDYMGKITLAGVELNQEITKSIPTSTLEGDFYKVEGTVEITYKPNPVYAEAITGQTEGCLDGEGNPKDSCRIIGYGVASKFVDGKKLTPTEATPLIRNFNFSITPSTNSIFTFGSGNACKYKVNPEIIKYPTEKGNIDLEFRVVDTTNPFNRNTKSNWSDGTNNNKNNQTVKDHITNNNVNNSYNRTGEGSLYTNQTDGTKRIILTPDLVQKIRDYNAGKPSDNPLCENKNPTYNDYTVHIEKDEDGTETTTTNFFKCIGLTKTS